MAQEENSNELDLAAKYRELIASNRRISSSLESRDIQRAIVEEACAVLEANASALLLRAETDLAELVMVEAHGFTAELAAHIHVPIGPGMIDRVGQLGLERGLTSYLGVPMLRRGETVGVLLVYRRVPFAPAFEALLSALAEQAAIALEHSRLYRESLESIAARQIMAHSSVGERTLLEAALEHTQVGVVIAEAPSGRTIVVNPALQQILAGKLESFDDFNQYAFARLDGSRVSFDALPMLRALREGQPVSDRELLFGAKQNRRLRCSAAPIRDAGGQVLAVVATFEDLTEQRRSDEVLRDTKERLRMLADDVKDYAIYTLDAEGRVESWNAGAQALYGYSAHEVLGRLHYLLYPQEDVLLGHPDQGLKVAIEKGRHDEEGWRLRKDGSRFWAASARITLYHPDGRLRGFAKFQQDITERMLTEEALRDSNRRIATTLESISDGYLALDREWRFIYVNPEAERLLGRQRAQLIGRHLVEVFPELAGSRFEHEFQRAMAEGGKTDFEERIPPLTSWFEVRAYASAVGLSIYIRDVTELRRARMAQRLLARAGIQLAESLEPEQTLERVVRLAVPDLADWCVAVTKDDNGNLRWSLAHADPTVQAWGRRIIDRIPPHAVPEHGVGRVLRTNESELMTAVPDAFLASVASDQEQLEMLRKLGLLSAVFVPLRARGRTLGAMGFGSTTLEHCYSEADLPLAEELGRRAALAVDNARLYREAQQATRARDEVMGIVAHDLKNPLSSILLAANLMTGGRGGDAPAARQKVAEAIMRAAERMNRLIRDLLDVTRIEAEGLALERDLVCAKTLVADSVELVRPQAAGLQVETEFSPELPPVFANRDRILQVFANLLGNALKFTASGGRISVGAEARGSEVCFWVEDSGVGIPPRELPHVFDRFWQGRGERAGTGLGLSICKAIVEAHGGRIWAESQAGRGSTFYFSIPVAPARGSRVAPDAQPAV